MEAQKISYSGLFRLNNIPPQKIIIESKTVTSSKKQYKPVSQVRQLRIIHGTEPI